MAQQPQQQQQQQHQQQQQEPPPETVSITGWLCTTIYVPGHQQFVVAFPVVPICTFDSSLSTRFL